MKNLKKILALVTALALTLALALPAFAVGTVADSKGDITVSGGTTGSITVPLPAKPGDATDVETNVNAHTFKAYQIFVAEYAKDKDGNNTDELVSIKWGNGLDSAKLETFWSELVGTADNPGIFYGQLKDDTFQANDANLNYNPAAYKLAQVVSTLKVTEGDTPAYTGTNGNDVAYQFAAIVEKYIVSSAAIEKGASIQPGYYLVVDAGSVNGVDQVYNLSVLAMGGEGMFNPTVKADVPELEKKVLEINDSDSSTSPDNYTWADVADYDINDTVTFALTGTLPSNYADYESYKYVFHDTLSNTLNLNADSIKVYVDGKELSKELSDGTSQYTVATTDLANSETFTVTFNNLKTLTLPEGATAITKDTIIQVVYTATLNENAALGATGNKNEATLEYSNNPNNGGEGETGTTPKDIVNVVTFQLEINKVDEDTTTPLSGAVFALYKFDASKKVNETTDDESCYVQVGNNMNGAGVDGNVFEFKGLDGGKYKLVEVTAPAGYNKAQDMYFEVQTKISQDAAGNVKVENLEVTKVTDKLGAEIKDAMGNAAYTINLKTVQSIDDSQTEEQTKQAALNAGILNTSIVNLKGLTLPSTGGIGTTIFYVVGGLLVLGAGVLLITKKRMGRSE